MSPPKLALRTVLAACGALTASVALAAAATPARAAGSGNPLAGWQFLVSSDSNAVRAVQADPAHAALLNKIAQRPQASWFVGGSPAQVRADVTKVVRAAHARHAMPVLVAYNLPKRDCGSYSGGGATSVRLYQQWATEFALGLGHLPATVVVEPDALGQLSCLGGRDQQLRLSLMRRFSASLHDQGAATYIDAGHSRWMPAAVARARLTAAGVRSARGFSLNVSNFGWSASEVAYGRSVAAGLGAHGHFVVDTSRNGRGPLSPTAWCNPAGRALGTPPTSATRDVQLDAYLWIKPPGASDGSCTAGAPPAGAWYHSYALGLAQRAP